MQDIWSVFRLRVNIRQPLEKVYAAWATRAGLESWFLRTALITATEGPRAGGEAIQAGDRYAWDWHGYPCELVKEGRFTAANGVDHVAFTFTQGYPVNIRLYREHDETIVELVESELPTDEDSVFRYHVGDSKGWIFYLTNLKSVLEGGLDLRNRKQELRNVITA